MRSSPTCCRGPYESPQSIGLDYIDPADAAHRAELALVREVYDDEQEPDPDRVRVAVSKLLRAKRAVNRG